MNKKEAHAILADHLGEYRRQSHTDLQRLLSTQDVLDVRADSGITYQLEFYALWDDKTRGHLRVCGCIDDGGIRAYFPLTDDFIIAPDGTFIGEHAT